MGAFKEMESIKFYNVWRVAPDYGWTFAFGAEFKQDRKTGKFRRKRGSTKLISIAPYEFRDSLQQIEDAMRDLVEEIEEIYKGREEDRKQKFHNLRWTVDDHNLATRKCL